MKTTGCRSFIASRVALIAAALTLGACDAVNELANSGDDDDVYYYLSLGDSLSVGVQPNSNGVLLPTGDGYPEQLFDSVRPVFEAAGAQNRELELVEFGCPGETTDDMINGGGCLYIAGSQLDAAVDYMNDNSDRVHLVTIDIGANEFLNAGCITTTVDLNCVNAVSAQIATDLATVLAALNGAAGPNTSIVGMNYYNPYLGSWIEDAAGQTLATESAQAAVILNDLLSTTYATAGIPMADVYAAFESDDFVNIVPSSLPPPNDMLPVSIANICQFTYMCDAAPVGPDIHANLAGYSLIANSFETVLP